MFRQDLSHLATKEDLEAVRLATKEDLEAVRLALEALRSELYKELNQQTWRYVGAMTVLTGVFAAIVKLL